MYDIFGIVDFGHRSHTWDHNAELVELSRKFPSRTKEFEKISRNGLILFGKAIRSHRTGDSEMFIAGEIYNL